MLSKIQKNQHRFDDDPDYNFPTDADPDPDRHYADPT
jgi:hypothetical protein